LPSGATMNLLPLSKGYGWTWRKEVRMLKTA